MHWWVSTPEYEYIDVILDDGTGPSEWSRDVVSVEAPTKRQAIIAGVKQMRSEEFFKKMGGRKTTYYGWAWDRDSNPFTGVKAENAECPHGICFCEIPNCLKWNDECKHCNIEYYKTVDCEHDMVPMLLYGTDTYKNRCINCNAAEDEINVNPPFSE